MNLVDLSPSLSIDVDKIIGIRDADTPDKKVLLLKGGDLLTITSDESILLRHYAFNSSQPISTKLKNEIFSIISACLDEYLSGKIIMSSSPRYQAPEEVERLESAEPSNHWKQSFSDNIVSYIVKENHSVKEAAEYFGVSERTVYRYLKEREIKRF